MPLKVLFREKYFMIYKKKMMGVGLKKAPKLTYSTVPPGNKKQNVNLALAIINETHSAAIMNYFPEKFDPGNFLSLFHKFFAIFSSKKQFNSFNQL